MSLRRIASITYWAEDVAAAAAWYTELLGSGPSFTRPGPGGRLGYAAFSIDERTRLAIAARATAPPGAALEPGGAVGHWDVADLDAVLERLASMGAKEYIPVTPHGPVVSAAVLDPFGNVLGLISDQHPAADFRGGPPRPS
ncbi:catechol 2,3-dioxygenase-like lactoylglutathione lyase family enzyme [Geodermatophilus bullaregiensis]|uniref:VOC family protein n=1 Tax=Geodermatophilus bullaregiensis TaxID=1564160 RepID=UPI00195A29FD|nr:VOC family protein [Geodermatophilus bullaregiensis]MBM7806740.1 catechol 2,3-dioxygenase-like lactoylglutathione lyase family enzyme [Geodermatophilus bullaregiensis]